MQLRFHKNHRKSPTGWFDLFAIAALLIFGTAYFATT